MVMETGDPDRELVLPVKTDVPLEQWSHLFPARHGRVSLGEFANTVRLPSPVVRLISSLHFEFGEFHRRIAQPLASEAGVSELIEYAFNLEQRMDESKPVMEGLESGEFQSLCEASMIVELVKLTLIDNEGFPAGKFPRWVLKHCLGSGFEDLEMEALSIIESEGALFKTDEPRFWEIIKKLAILDLGPIVSKLLRMYMDVHTRPRSSKRNSIELLVRFYEEVPSLYDIAATARSQEEAISLLDKRRVFASVAAAKGSHDPAVTFLWKLHENREEDHTILNEEIMGIWGDDFFWFGKVLLAWAWLHPLDIPDAELVRELAEFAVNPEREATSLDAAVHAILSNDLVSLFTVVVETQDNMWLPPLLAELCFYAGAVPIEVRDSLLLNHCHWLSASGQLPAGLGTRMAADIVQTLSPRACERAGPEIFGRLARGKMFNRTKQWLSAVKLAAPVNQSWAESMCMEKFHCDRSAGRIVDAIHSLSLAAEVGPDVHVGACRISDFLDGNTDEVKNAFKTVGSQVTKNLLPEYIESGRYEFLSSWASEDPNLIALVSLPNCPPEKVVELVTEIRNSGKKLTVEETVALCKVLSDLDTWLVHPAGGSPAGAVEVLLSWLATQVVV